jgi:hypothetical protein
VLSPQLHQVVRQQSKLIDDALGQQPTNLNFKKQLAADQMLKLFDSVLAAKTTANEGVTHTLTRDVFVGDAVFGISFKADNVDADDLAAMKAEQGLIQTTESGYSFRFFTDAKAETVRAEIRKEDLFKVEGDDDNKHNQRLMKTMVGMVSSIVAVQNELHFYGENKLMVAAGLLYAQRLSGEAGLANLKITVEGIQPPSDYKAFFTANKDLVAQAKTFIDQLDFSNLRDEQFYNQAVNRGPAS